MEAEAARPNVRSGSAPDADRSLSVFLRGMPPFGNPAWVAAMAQTATTSGTAATTTAIALFLLGRKRRKNEADDGRDADPSRAAAAVVGYLVEETHLPRWRRPSLSEARGRNPGPAIEALVGQRLTFERAGVPRVEGRELRSIRYRMVRLTDRPDEIVSNEIGQLDQGDEVEVVERSGTFVRVRTPYGQEGWVHKTTVGALVNGEPAAREGTSAAEDPAHSAALEAGYAGGPDDILTRLLQERARSRP